MTDSAWARVVNGRIAEKITFDPTNMYHPEIEWISIPININVGATMVGGDWVNPEPPAPLPPPPPPPPPGIKTRLPTPPEFETLFSIPESIRLRTSTDPVIMEFIRRIDDVRMVSVDLDSPVTTSGVNYLTTMTTGGDNGPILTADRATAILAGYFPT